MIGKPKYNCADIIKFKLEGKEYIGEVWIIDKYGTWNDPSDVSYDILVEDAFKEGDEYYKPGKDNSCLFKHITEKLIIEKL